MNKVKPALNRFAIAISAVLSTVLFICANTASCAMIYEPVSPNGLKRFSKIE